MSSVEIIPWAEATKRIGDLLVELSWEIGKQASPTVILRARSQVEAVRTATPDTIVSELRKAVDLFGLGVPFVDFAKKVLEKTVEYRLGVV